MPVFVCDGVEASPLKVPARQTENHNPDLLFAKQQCHLVLIRDRWNFLCLTIKVFETKANGSICTVYRLKLDMFTLFMKYTSHTFDPCRSSVTEINLKD